MRQYRSDTPPRPKAGTSRRFDTPTPPTFTHPPRAIVSGCVRDGSRETWMGPTSMKLVVPVSGVLSVGRVGDERYEVLAVDDDDG